MTSDTLIPLRRIARLKYGEAIPDEARTLDGFPVMGSGGQSGFASRWNARGPVTVVGRKGSFGSVRWQSENSYVTDTAFYVEPLDGSDPRWLFYALHSVNLSSLSQDVGVPGLSREAAYSVRIPKTELDIQRSVAAFLDSATEKLDRLLRACEEQRDLLSERSEAALIDEFLGLKSPGSRTRLKFLFSSIRNGVWGDEPTGGHEDRVCVRVADFDRLSYTADRAAPTLRSFQLVNR